MKEMNLICKNNVVYADSRDVAELIGKRHTDLLRDIDRYIEVLIQNAKLRFDDFFVETSYTAGTGKNYKAYFLTKKGCDMVANKMTGDKGVLFTATYIDQFYAMEAELRKKPVDTLKAERLAVMKRNAKVREANTPFVRGIFFIFAIDFWLHV